jgi:plasmid stabilization system protein ParE
VIVMRRIVWRRGATRDLFEIAAWLNETPHGNPVKVRDAIREAVERLARLGDIGRPAKGDSVLRVLSVRTKPYLVVYCPHDDWIEIVSVVGARTRRADRF